MHRWRAQHSAIEDAALGLSIVRRKTKTLLSMYVIELESNSLGFIFVILFHCKTEEDFREFHFISLKAFSKVASEIESESQLCLRRSVVSRCWESRNWYFFELFQNVLFCSLTDSSRMIFINASLLIRCLMKCLIAWKEKLFLGDS